MARRNASISKSYTDDKQQLSSVTTELYDIYNGRLSFDGNLPSLIFRTKVTSGQVVSFPAYPPLRFAGAQLIWHASPVKKMSFSGESVTIEFEGGGNVECRFLVIFD